MQSIPFLFPSLGNKRQRMIMPYRRNGVESRFATNHSRAADNQLAHRHVISKLQTAILGGQFHLHAAHRRSKMRPLMKGLVSPIVKDVRLCHGARHLGRDQSMYRPRMRNGPDF